MFETNNIYTCKLQTCIEIREKLKICKIYLWVRCELIIRIDVLIKKYLGSTKNEKNVIVLKNYLAYTVTNIIFQNSCRFFVSGQSVFRISRRTTFDFLDVMDIEWKHFTPCSRRLFVCVDCDSRLTDSKMTDKYVFDADLNVRWNQHDLPSGTIAAIGPAMINIVIVNTFPVIPYSVPRRTHKRNSFKFNINFFFLIITRTIRYNYRMLNIASTTKNTIFFNKSKITVLWNNFLGKDWC